MQQLVVEIPQRQYPIFVAEGLLADTQKLRELLLARIQGAPGRDHYQQSCRAALS